MYVYLCLSILKFEHKKNRLSQRRFPILNQTDNSYLPCLAYLVLNRSKARPEALRKGQDRCSVM